MIDLTKINCMLNVTFDCSCAILVDNINYIQETRLNKFEWLYGQQCRYVGTILIYIYMKNIFELIIIHIDIVYVWKYFSKHSNKQLTEK